MTSLGIKELHISNRIHSNRSQNSLLLTAFKVLSHSSLTLPSNTPSVTICTLPDSLRWLQCLTPSLLTFFIFHQACSPRWLLFSIVRPVPQIRCTETEYAIISHEIQHYRGAECTKSLVTFRQFDICGLSRDWKIPNVSHYVAMPKSINYSSSACSFTI